MTPIEQLALVDEIVRSCGEMQANERVSLPLAVALEDLREAALADREEVHEAACEQAAAERRAEEQARAAAVQAEFREIEMAARGPLFMRRYFSPRLKALILRRYGKMKYEQIPW